MAKISILCMDVANECMTRSVLLAEALQRKHEVEILGVLWRSSGRTDELWAHFQDIGIPIRPVIGKGWPGFFLTVVRILRLINSDVIIACKVRPASFGIALLKKLVSGIPVILDVDDDEVAITRSATGKRKKWWPGIGHPNQHRETRLVRRFCRYADAVISVSERFQREYGGVIAPHGRDPDDYDPEKIDGEAIRKSLGFTETDQVIGFIGTPRPMKGIHILFDALEKLARPDVKLMIVGGDMASSYMPLVKARCGENAVLIPPVPMGEVPNYIAASDMIVLPQINDPLTSGQMPAKLTEAMAMAKPIIASAMADIPRYLDGCGIVVPPEDVSELAKKIAWIADHPEQARELGQRARARFLKDMTMDYLFDVVDGQVKAVLSQK